MRTCLAKLQPQKLNWPRGPAAASESTTMPAKPRHPHILLPGCSRDTNVGSFPRDKSPLMGPLAQELHIGLAKRSYNHTTLHNFSYPFSLLPCPLPPSLSSFHPSLLPSFFLPSLSLSQELGLPYDLKALPASSHFPSCLPFVSASRRTHPN